MQNCESLEDKMSRIKRQNAELLKRHMEVEADKNKAAKAKALVGTHANIDVKAMTPAERNATLESRSRVTEARDNNALIYSYQEQETGGRKLQSRLGINSTKWESSPEVNGKYSEREYIQRPKLVSSSRKALVRMLLESSNDDVFKNVEPLNASEQSDEGEYSGPFKSPKNLELHQTDVLESSEVSENGDPRPCELQFDPDMDLTVPPPPFQRSKIYGSGRLSKSRLNDTSNLPDLLADGAQCSDNYEQDLSSEPDVFSPLNYPSLQMLAEALNTCQTDQYQPQVNNQELQPDYTESYDHTSWPGMGNFDDVSALQEPRRPEPTVTQRKKSALELRMEAVRQERCKRFSRAQYMAQDSYSEVEITYVKNSPDLQPE